MTVLDNVAFAAGHKRIGNLFLAMGGLDRSAERDRAMTILDSLGIGEVAHGRVQGQPLGILKRLEVARALAMNPEVLLLDEPLAGLNSVEAEKLADTIVDINGRGVTVLMIEHNLGEVLRVSHRLVVLDNGIKIAEGDPEDVINDPAVRAAYMGKEEDHAAA
jgi:branched-chain amino acid transport system ATP-binding protein